MKKINLNTKEGIVGIIFLSLAISLFCFFIAYFIEAGNWVGENGSIARNWFVGGSIKLVIAIVLTVFSLRLLRKSKVLEKKIKKFDFHEIKGFLSLAMIPAGFIFSLNGIIYMLESLKWQRAMYYYPQSWYLTEAASWNTTAMVMFIIAAILVCGGVALLAINHKEQKKKTHF